jgi:hypothetical protein
LHEGRIHWSLIFVVLKYRIEREAGMGQEYADLRCGFTPDGKLKAEAESVHKGGDAVASTTVGSPDKFTSKLVMRYRPDLKLSDSVFDLSEKDVGGHDQTKSILATTIQRNLQECAKKFPSF